MERSKIHEDDFLERPRRTAKRQKKSVFVLNFLLHISCRALFDDEALLIPSQSLEFLHNQNEVKLKVYRSSQVQNRKNVNEHALTYG